MKRAALTQQQQKRVEVLLAQNLSLREIARDLGMSEATFVTCVALTRKVVCRTLMPVEEFNRLLTEPEPA